MDLRRAKGTYLLGVLAAVVLWVLPTASAQAAETPDSYMDTVATHLRDPGVWVDPRVTGLTPGQIETLNDAARKANAPIRIAVVPATSLRTPDSVYLEWDGKEIADQLANRIKVNGVYAVLVAASSSTDGRGLQGVQRSGFGSKYAVGDAVNKAVDCCAPDYFPILSTFIEQAQVTYTPFYIRALQGAGGLAGLIVVVYGVLLALARRARRSDQKTHLSVVRPVLDEEIAELSNTVVTQPPQDVPELTARLKVVRDAVDEARRGAETAKSDDDVSGVTAALGWARYNLYCLHELRAGRTAPEQTPPCTLDPRHGPSTARMEWSFGKDHGRAREVDVCADCKARDDAGQEPAVRTAKLWSIDRPYWEFPEELGAYVEGYWTPYGKGFWSFPDNEFRRRGEEMRQRWRSYRPGARFGRFSSRVGTSVGDVLEAANSSRNNNRYYYNRYNSSNWSSSSSNSSSGSDSSGGDSGSRSF
jgi:hypothetical protein